MNPSPRPKVWKARGGFTVTELMVSTAVTSVLMAICLAGSVALQKFQAVCLARSGARAEVIRMFDSLELDLRNATAVTAAVSGSENVLPLTLTVPQRYSAYTATGDQSGDPTAAASRIQPTVNATSGKVGVSSNTTVRYTFVANGATAQDVMRTVTWTEGGVAQTASRVISTVPSTATVRFRSSDSTSASPSPIPTGATSLVAKVNAPLASARSANAVPTTLESTIFLRRKSIK